MRIFITFLSVLFLLNLTSCATRVAVRPTKTVVIKTPPKHYKIVKVKGKRYYFWNGKHYRKTRKGYIFLRV